MVCLVLIDTRSGRVALFGPTVVQVSPLLRSFGVAMGSGVGCWRAATCSDSERYGLWGRFLGEYCSNLGFVLGEI